MFTFTVTNSSTFGTVLTGGALIFILKREKVFSPLQTFET